MFVCRRLFTGDPLKWRAAVGKATVMIGIVWKVIVTDSKLLGHANLTMTLRYAHLAPDHLKSAVDVLSNLSSNHALKKLVTELVTRFLPLISACCDQVTKVTTFPHISYALCFAVVMSESVCFSLHDSLHDSTAISPQKRGQLLS